MTCDYFKELISAQIDGELSPDESQALKQHLLECTACAKFSAGLSELSYQIIRQPAANMPDALAQKILLVTVGNERQQGIGQKILTYFGASYRIPRVAVWGAAAVLMLLLGKIAFIPAQTNDAESLSPKKSTTTTETQKIVLTENDVVAVDGLRIQRIDLSDADITTTRELVKFGLAKH
jgi:predicted anti-sigma-YlaC factor YlaD